jgi:ribosomal protein L11 methyltransferase
VKTSGYSRVAIITSFEAEDAVAALLERLFQSAPSIYTDIEKQHSVVMIYAPETQSTLWQTGPELERGLKQLEQCGLNIGAGKIVIKRVRREDWSESWKKHFRTIEVGSGLMIKPSWSREKPKNGQALVVLDPGLSFGTGQHATTAFCLKQIVRARPYTDRSLLDVGCGSGILAISAAKLGYGRVDAFDFDPVAVRVARKNCRDNAVESVVHPTRQDLRKLPLQTRKKYDLICANLTSDLLVSERDRILARLARSGTLILAGILATEFPAVQKCYENSGLHLRNTRTEREWQSGAFVMKCLSKPVCAQV